MKFMPYCIRLYLSYTLIGAVCMLSARPVSLRTIAAYNATERTIFAALVPTAYKTIGGHTVLYTAPDAPIARKDILIWEIPAGMLAMLQNVPKKFGLYERDIWASYDKQALIAAISFERKQSSSVISYNIGSGNTVAFGGRIARNPQAFGTLAAAQKATGQRRAAYFEQVDMALREPVAQRFADIST